MRSYKDLSRKYLKSQKRRTRYTIIGITLAVALITAVSILGINIQAASKRNIEDMTGSYHAVVKNISEDEMRVLKHHAKVDSVGVVYEIGFVEGLKRDTQIMIQHCNTEALNMLGKELVAGRWPENSEEIVLEETALKLLGVQLIPGETIEIKIKTKVVTPQELTGKYLLVGIAKDGFTTRTNFAYGYIGLPPEIIGITPNAYFRLKSESNLERECKTLAESLGFEDRLKLNRVLIESLRDKAKTNFIVIVLGFMIAIAASVSIYNIINISVLERIRDFGLLRAAGATVSQIRKIVYHEAAILSLKAIPLGLFLGFVLASLVIFTGTLGLNIEIKTVVIEPWIIAMSALLGIIMVWISVLGPAVKAGKISPIEAIRFYWKPDKISENSLLTRVFGTLFGTTGKLACRNLLRNRSRTLITIISMIMSVTLFIVSTIFFASMDLDRLVGMYMRSDFSLSSGWGARNGPGTSQVEYIASIDGVNKVVAARHSIVQAMFKKEDVNDSSIISKFMDGVFERQRDPETGKYPVQSDLLGYNAQGLEELNTELISGSISDRDFEREDLVIITRRDSERFNLKPGDKLQLRIRYLNEEMKLITLDYDFTVAAVVERFLTTMDVRSPGLQLVTLDKKVSEYFRVPIMGETSGNKGIDVYNYVDIFCDSKADLELIRNQLERIAFQYSGTTLNSYEKEIEKLKKSKNELAIMIYGITAVIAFIALFSVINTLNSNIILRRREFGLMRAVGASNNQLKKMVVLEGAIFGIISAAWGTLLGTGLAYILYHLAKKELSYLTWSFPLLVIFGAIAASILIGILATIAPIKRLSRLKIVEAINTIE
ncbi:ABC transporter permease [Kosmotoga olearia]|uniref:ABC3 transporter permease protein domain-containing protein n=1 Tax=Kosmotoga olearia (strain ATCC BAA-1733 / DSM 21960 / TBF 19.5.1) TaxID=521045 RepID=C5CGA4_KOSOT|nr:ABC transporter permease [Kosmotoga olearia]ACR79545.1 protein of unknown function DUF214 [Kosmotoga olearia TBF 19.5.1]